MLNSIIKIITKNPPATIKIKNGRPQSGGGGSDVTKAYVDAADNALQASKQDKEEGKGLSELNFTTILKNLYDAASNWVATNGAAVLSAITNLQSSKQDKEAGKGLSKNDLTDTLKANYDSAYNKRAQFTSETTYSQTVTFSGTNTPSGTPDNKWLGQRVGNVFNLWMYLSYENQGNSVSSIEVPLPTGAPLPITPSNMQDYSGVFIWPANGFVSRENGAVYSSFMQIFLMYKGSGNPPTIYGTLANRAVKVVTLFVSYPIN